MVIEYDPDYAAELGYKDGFKERFSRKRLIEMQGIPVQYGPGVSALWATGTGPSAVLPNWCGACDTRVKIDLSRPTGVASGSMDLRSMFGAASGPASGPVCVNIL